MSRNSVRCTALVTWAQATHLALCSVTGPQDSSAGCPTLAEDEVVGHEKAGVLELRQLRSRAMHAVSPSPMEHEVFDLPGLDRAARGGSRMLTGYIPVALDGTRQLFYWYVQSRGSPRTDPVLLWTNGGPGCSGLWSALTAMGPFQIAGPGTLTRNQWSWAEFANMIFVEQPAGVGFSINRDPSYEYNDANSASDMWEFIKGFMARHHELRHLPFYLTSQSYGGHYLPATALHIARNNQGEVNFKGFAVGNPLTYYVYRNYGEVTKWAFTGLLPMPDYEEYVAKNCYFFSSDKMDEIKSEDLMRCVRLNLFFNQLVEGLDAWALSFPKCTDDEVYVLMNHSVAPVPTETKHVLESVAPKLPYQPCSTKWAEDYLNTAVVRKALNVQAPNVTWKYATMDVRTSYNMTDFWASMIPTYQLLIAEGTMQIMIFSGDDDSICSSFGTQKLLWDMGYNNTEKWHPYLVSGQVAGFTTNFTAGNGAGVRFTTVHGAGHSVAATQPERAFHVLRRFLLNEWS